MRILFDQGTPAPLRRALPLHNVETSFERGWSTLVNGELLSAAEAAGFDVLVTTDMNLRYQQDLTLELTRFRGRLTRPNFGAEVAHGIEQEGSSA